MTRLLMIFSVALSAALAYSQTAAEILQKVDANRAYASIEYSARMEIKSGGAIRVKTMKAWSDGTGKAFVEFTNPEDKGVRMLKIAKDLWMYFPKEQDTVKISGYLLKDGMMGSDVSYEDAMESDAVATMYSATLKEKLDLDGRPTYVVELKATDPKAKYDRRVLYVDAERFTVGKEEMYAKSGKLLKLSTILEFRLIGRRWFPVKVEISDKLRRDSSTTFVIEQVALDVAVDPARFTRATLEK